LCRFEFHSSFFYVKDLITKTVLLSSQSKDDLYILTESLAMCFPQAFLSNSADVWHQHLDHPSSRVLSLLASNKKVVCTSRPLNFQCQACPSGKSSSLSLGHTSHQAFAPLELVLVMCGTLLLCYLQMIFFILLFLWMRIRNLSGFIFLSLNLMSSMCFINFKSSSNDNSLKKLNMFKLIGVVNIIN